MSDPVRVVLHTVLWLTLGGWVGGMLLFGLAVAPTAFSVLPSSRLAGQMVSGVLTPLQLYGAGAGLLLAALALALGRGLLRTVLPLVLSALCLFSHFGITGSMEEIREAAFGTPGDPEATVRFGELHRLSMLLYFATGIGALVLAGLHGSADVAAQAGPKKRQIP